MNFTSLSLGFLICEMGIKRPAAQVCCRDDTAGEVQGLIPVTLVVQPPHLLLLPCENRSEAEAERQVRKTQRALSVYLGKGTCPSSFSAGPVRLYTLDALAQLRKVAHPILPE